MGAAVAVSLENRVLWLRVFDSWDGYRTGDFGVALLFTTRRR